MISAVMNSSCQLSAFSFIVVDNTGFDAHFFKLIADN